MKSYLSCAFHHEKWDGHGYPDRALAGEDIPFEAQIIGIADFYDALDHQKTLSRSLSVTEQGPSDHHRLKIVGPSSILVLAVAFEGIIERVEKVTDWI